MELAGNMITQYLENREKHVFNSSQGRVKNVIEDHVTHWVFVMIKITSAASLLINSEAFHYIYILKCNNNKRIYDTLKADDNFSIGLFTTQKWHTDEKKQKFIKLAEIFLKRGLALDEFTFNYNLI